MVGASKILTVSYGTFSCTLEGFDEPFNTMKAIAEYFRDLAADDRYFGAEPPTPDAAMLHKIAEREVQRRVTAHVEDNGVILRASDADQPTALAPNTAPAPATPQAAPDTLYEDQHANEATPVSESVAAKLSRIRNAVAGARASGETTRPPQNLAAALAAAEAEEAQEAKRRAAQAEAEALAKAEAEAEARAKAIAEADAIAKAQAAEEARAAAAAKALAEEQAEAARALAEEQAARDLQARAEAEAEAIREEARAALIAAQQADDEGEIENEAGLAEITPEEEELQNAAPGLRADEFIEDLEEDEAADTAAAPIPFPSEDDASDWQDGAADAGMFDTPFEASDEPELEVADTSDVDADDRLLATLAGAFGDDKTALNEGFEDEDLSEDLSAEGDDTLMASLSAAMADEDDKVEVEELREDIVDVEGLDDLGVLTDDEDLADLPDLDDDEDIEDLAALDGVADDQFDGDDFDSDDISDEEASEAAFNARVPTAFGDDFAADQGSLDETPAEEEELHADTDVEAVEDDSISASDEAPEEEEHPSVNPETQAKLQRARARVIKIRRADTAAPKVAAEAPEAEAPVADAPVASAEDKSSLSPEAEAELMRELEDLQQEPSPEPVKPVRPQRPVSSHNRTLSEDDEDESVKRLINQTNNEMQGPENRRRLSAIAHLKAAVAATVADRKSGGKDGPSEETRINPYRSDLERVVRPTHMPDLLDEPRKTEPVSERPAPLVLVSEQRIDAPRIRPTGPSPHVTPVRPRRVGAGNLAVNAHQDEEFEDDDDDISDEDAAGNIFGETRSFAEFSERLGAEDLPDLLEAAAAYSACVEGRPHISRPQMMNHVLTVVDDDEGNRETLLRSFGTLLREGRIEKVSRGQFALNGESPMLAKARDAAEG